MLYQSNSVDIVKVKKGDKGDSYLTYMIETSQEEVLKFKQQTETKDISLVFSPSSLEMTFYDNSIKSKKKIIDFQTDKNFSYQIKVNDFNDSYEISGAYLKETETKGIRFDIDTLVKDTKSTQNEKARKLLLKADIIPITITLLKQKEVVATHLVICRYGTTEEMATFNLYSSGIVAAIQNTKMSFSAEGLQIKNGGFNIIDKNNEIIFDANRSGGIYVKGNGIFEGTVKATDGIFRGRVEANGGIFNDDIDINGSLRINDPLQQRNIFIGKKKDSIGIGSSNYVEGDKGFFLSTDGTLYANSLRIGNDAKIINKLSVGNSCFIQNPEQSKTNSNFIYIKDENGKDIFSISKDGSMLLSNPEKGTGIIFGGKGEQIQSLNYFEGYRGWSINNDKSEFNDVTIRGTIESSVISYGKVQAVGGMLLVRPSTRIKAIYSSEDNIHFLVIPATPDCGVKKGDFCKISEDDSLYQITDYDSEGQGRIFLIKVDKTSSINDYPYRPISEDDPLKLVLEKDSNLLTLPVQGQENENGIYFVTDEKNLIAGESGSFRSQFSIKDNEVKGLYNYERYKTKNPTEGRILIDYGKNDSVGILINSTTNSSPGSEQAISIFTSSFREGKFEKKPRIVLGKIPKEGISDLQQGLLNGKNFGLYADNVYLKGGLIAEGSSFYSGINSYNTVKMPNIDNTYFPDREVGNILFWAGAQSQTEQDIERAPFKVDSYGNLYANSGYFEGTIITNATITASKLRTAVIEGYDPLNKKEASLVIRNTDNAISFKDTSNNTQLSLNSKEMMLGVELKLKSDLVMIKENTEVIRLNGLTGIAEVTSVKARNPFSDPSKTSTLNSRGLVFSRDQTDEMSLHPFYSLEEDQKGLSFCTYQSGAEQEHLRVQKGKISFYEDINLSENIVLKRAYVNNDCIGYDLYISD